MRKKSLLITISLFITLFFLQPISASEQKYLRNPLSVMGFTKETTMDQVKKQLNNWEISWEVSPFDYTMIRINNVSYLGCSFRYIKFWFYFNGTLKGIVFEANYSESEEAIWNCFSQISKGCPYRNDYISSSGLSEYTVFNGSDSSEFAVYNLTTNVFGFSFRGSAYELFGINP